MSFGDGTVEAEVAARYAGIDGHAIAAAQREAEAKRENVGQPVRYNSEVDPAAPTAWRPAPRLSVATEKAINFLVSLSSSRTPHVAEKVIRDWAATVHWKVVSTKIDELKAMPVVTTATGPARPAQEIPAGRYAVTGEEGQTVFVRIDRPTEGEWKGRTFVKVQAGSDLHRVSRSTSFALQNKILADGIKEAMLRYGREIGACGACGRTLTDEASREAGIGPVCRGKLGW